MPEISVIVPMYKTPKLRLRKCLDSLIQQTFLDFEVLVIDDGNAPGYEYLMEEYEAADSRIQFIRQEHSGVSVARNLGLSLAKGKYISFVDSDDYVDPLFLEELHEAMADADVAICAISEQYYPVHPGWTDRHVFFSKPSFYNGLQYINFCHNKMYRADLIRKNNITFKTGMKLGEDADFLAAYLLACKSFRKVREPRYHYVPDSNSAVHRYRDEFWQWERKVIALQWDMFHTYPLSRFEEQAMEHWLYEKIRFSLNYYIERESDRSSRKQHLKEICKDELYLRLTSSALFQSHLHLTMVRRMTILFWKYFGVTGIKCTYLARRVWRRLRRRS